MPITALPQPHGSLPANPLMVEPLYLSQYIERLGTGTGDMIRRCPDAGLPEALFAVDDGLHLTLERPAPQTSTPVPTEETKEETKEQTTEETGGNPVPAPDPSGASPSRPRERILALMREHPEVTTAALARALNLTDSGVDYHLRRLRRDGRIRREGSTKAGRRVVLP